MTRAARIIPFPQRKPAPVAHREMSRLAGWSLGVALSIGMWALIFWGLTAHPFRAPFSGPQHVEGR
ncbi:hypothetical protein [Methylobacterium durans]|uniref:Uncharacterized protein n=1 Tax=Methylobacterium durans TaxID=2202825 RepID=A0A2U8WAH4_9HYPH|nr:hypothetical protein [Methylobacterium durans]AWN43137.1 hypothetical protein DK389_24895 [Methylobacterium durans]